LLIPLYDLFSFGYFDDGFSLWFYAVFVPYPQIGWVGRSYKKSVMNVFQN